ncbi:MAG: reverse transcriptase domain-containing protein, partial [Aeromonas sp.]
MQKNLPDLTPLITFPTNIESLDVMTSNMGTIFSNTLEAVAPMKSKRINEKITAPWYNNTTRALKRETRKLERKWKQTQLEVFKIAWKESASCYKKALKAAKAEYFRNLIENNKNNPRFLFSTIAKLTNKQTPPTWVLVLLDLSAAFDTVDHKILLDRLHNYTGIQGQALQWFRSYLTDRYQYVHLKGKSSYLTQVYYGLPQGSVLGPLLFSIYMLPLG